MQKKCTDYIHPKSLHPSLQPIYQHLSKRNIIIYGPPGTSKYTQAMNILNLYSKSKLKYETKININHNDEETYYKITDTHIEVNFELLGCKAKTVWHSIYNAMQAMTGTRPYIYILCSNFQTIHSDLLKVFDCYMQKNDLNNIEIFYIILTSAYSFIPDNIRNKCYTINIAKPSKTNILKIFGKKYQPYISLNEYIYDIKLPNYGDKVLKQIVDFILEVDNFNIERMRELLYNLLQYNVDIMDFINYVITDLYVKKYITEINSLDIFIKTHQFIKLYNNNYRSIFHLEKYVVTLIKDVHHIKGDSPGNTTVK